jgi:catechol 2,3-dioxygenase-like lactoylglutathione lyase family enzyme
VKFALDHVVIAVHDLAPAIEDYRALGFTVVMGGRHPPPRTSSNALVVFHDGSYLELISWDPPNPAERWSNLLQERGEGIVDFAVTPEDLPAAVEQARARGVEIVGPVDGQRLRPDRTLVKWQTARPTSHDLPFFCADVTDRALRVPEGAVRDHANGVTGISRVDVGVAELFPSYARYAQLLGPGVLRIGAATLHLTDAPRRNGPMGIVLVAPRAVDFDGAPTHGASLTTQAPAVGA